MTSKQYRYNVIKDAFSSVKSNLTMEEIDCERRGYKLTKTILGSGAYAKVKMAYAMENKLDKDKRLAEDLRAKGHNIIAIKVVSKRQAPSEYLQKFMPREIDALNATCRHHNVIQLYETFHSNDKIYLVMEYASKGDLLDYINSQCRRCVGIGEALAKHFFRQLVEGVLHCHRRNVVHRDLKCENILIDDNNIIKISDFGFATRSPSNRTNLLETFCGSYAYAAPEILQAKKYDGKCSDVWSMGIILYAMICGKLPFNDNCSIHSLVLQTKSRLNFPTRGTCSQECQQLVRAILRSDPNERITVNRMLVDAWIGDSRESHVGLYQKSPAQLHSPGVEPVHDTRPVHVKAHSRLSNRATSTTPRIVEEEIEPKTPKSVKNVSREGTPVMRHGWSSTPGTPEPCTVAKLLHKRNAAKGGRHSVASQALECVSATPTDDRTDRCATPASGRNSPCVRGLTPNTPSVNKPTNRKELPVKVAQIITELGYSKRPKSRLSRETYVIMHRAVEEAQYYKQTRNDVRDTKQQVWRYVKDITSSGKRSTTPKETKPSGRQTGIRLGSVHPTPPPDTTRPCRKGVAPLKRIMRNPRQLVGQSVRSSSVRYGTKKTIMSDTQVTSALRNGTFRAGTVYKGVLRQNLPGGCSTRRVSFNTHSYRRQ